MSNYLRQSTAASVLLGPFITDTDGYTPQTSLTIPSASVYVSKRGANLVAKNDSSTASHLTLGYYQVLLDTTDTASAGNLFVATSPSGALPVWRTFTVLSASVYDSLITGASYLPVGVEMWDGTAVPIPDTAGVPKVSITASGMSASSIKAATIYADAFAASAINNTVFAANSGSVVWNAAVRGITTMGASAITASAIAGSAIYPNAIAASAFTANKFAASALDNNSFALTAASQVWNSAVRTITGGSVIATSGSVVATSGSVVTTSNLDKTGYVLAASSIAGSTIAASTISDGTFALTAASQIWNAAVRGITTMGACAIGTTAISGSAINAATIAASAILATHLKTGAITGDAIAGSAISSTKLTSGTIVTDTFAASTINNTIFAATAGSVVWNNAVRTVTGGSVVATSGSVVATNNLDKTGYVLAASSIAASTLAASAIDNNSFALTGASQVWNAAIRIITGGSVIATSGSVVTTTNLDKSNYVLAASSIAASTLADNAISNTTLAASTLNSNNVATSAGSVVWNAAIRTITGGSITANSDKLNYGLSGSALGEISASTSGSAGGATAADVWSYANRIVTGGSVIATSGSVVATTVLDKSNYVLAASSIAASTLAASAITNNTFALSAASQIWNAAIRTITGGSVTTNNDKTNYGLSSSALNEISASMGSSISASDIWNYNSRVVTGGSVVAVSGSVVTTSNLDKTNYTLTSAYDAAKTAASQASISALNNISIAQVQAAATSALNTYDGPTNAELEARTIISASYATPTNIISVGSVGTVTNPVTAGSVNDKSNYTLTSAYDAAKNAASQTSVNDLPTNTELATALTTIPMDVDEIIEGSYTMRDMLRIITGVLAGKLSGGGTNTVVFRDVTDSTDIVTATVDNIGDRLALTIRLT